MRDIGIQHIQSSRSAGVSSADFDREKSAHPASIKIIRKSQPLGAWVTLCGKAPHTAQCRRRGMPGPGAFFSSCSPDHHIDPLVGYR